jgi:hypothetical protein
MRGHLQLALLAGLLIAGPAAALAETVPLATCEPRPDLSGLCDTMAGVFGPSGIEVVTGASPSWASPSAQITAFGWSANASKAGSDVEATGSLPN